MTNEQPLPVLVLLPGLHGTGKLFTEFVEALRSTVDCVVVAYPKDQPLGYGELEGLVISALPKDRSFVLLGESFSGPLAIRIAARLPAEPPARAPKRLVGVRFGGFFGEEPHPPVGVGWR